MLDTIEVSTRVGTFELLRPKAGVRNRAMIKAETDSGAIRQVVLMTELLPKVISRRPEACDNTVPIEQILDALECDDYDKLVKACDELIASVTVDDLKKKEPSSSQQKD